MLIFYTVSGVTTDELAEMADVALGKRGMAPVGKITRTKNGAPVSDNYRISFSHTTGLVVMACSDMPVGIDVEKDGRKVPAGMKDVRNWTAYEAKCKLTGEGIKLSEVRKGGDFTPGTRYPYVIKGYTVAVAGGDDGQIAVVDAEQAISTFSPFS